MENPRGQRKAQRMHEKSHSFWKSCLGWALSPGSLTGTKGPLTGAPAQCTGSLSRGYPPGALTCQRLRELGDALPQRAAQHVDERLGEDRGQSASVNGGCSEPSRPGLSSTILCCFSRGLSGKTGNRASTGTAPIPSAARPGCGSHMGSKGPRDT